MRFLALGLFLVAAPAATAADSARYTFEPTENGVFRLDTETGEVSLCMSRNGALVCLRSPGQADGRLASRADADVAALEARIAALEAGSAGERAPGGEGALGRVKILAERMMGRLTALVREMKGEPREAL